MAINLVKLENDLKNAPDQAIVGYVQNPSGQVPTYLALAELERRKRMRQGAMASQGGEQPSVADQLVAESQPQPQMGGIADIPVQNVGNEESYAAGGIVAFEDGGEVQRYSEKGLVTLGAVPLSDEEYAKLSPVEKVQYDRNRAAVAGYTTMKPFAAAADLVGGPLNLGYQALESAGNLVPRAAKALGVMDPNSDYRLTLPRIGSGTATPYTDMIRQAEAQRFGTASEAPLVMAPTQPNEQQQYANAEAAKLRQRIGAGEFAQAQPTDVTAPKQRQRDDVNVGPGITNISGLPTWVAPKLKDYDVAPYEAMRGEKPTQEGVMSLMEAERARRGIATDPYAPLMKDLQAEKGQLRDQFKQDTWMRLAEFGATLAATPGSFGAAVGEAGKKVIPSVIADKKEMKKAERELTKEVNQMALAREGMLEARMKGDMDKYDKDQDRYMQAESKVLDMRNKNVDLFNSVAMKGAEKSFDAKLKAFEEEQATKRTNITAAASRENAAATREQTQLYREMDTNKRAQDARQKYIDAALTELELGELAGIERKLATDGKYPSDAVKNRHLYFMKKRKDAEKKAEELYPLASRYSGEYGGGTGGELTYDPATGKWS